MHTTTHSLKRMVSPEGYNFCIMECWWCSIWTQSRGPREKCWHLFCTAPVAVWYFEGISAEYISRRFFCSRTTPQTSETLEKSCQLHGIDPPPLHTRSVHNPWTLPSDYWLHFCFLSILTYLCRLWSSVNHMFKSPPLPHQITLHAQRWVCFIDITGCTSNNSEQNAKLN